MTKKQSGCFYWNTVCFITCQRAVMICSCEGIWKGYDWARCLHRLGAWQWYCYHSDLLISLCRKLTERNTVTTVFLIPVYRALYVMVSIDVDPVNISCPAAVAQCSLTRTPACARHRLLSASVVDAAVAATALMINYRDTADRYPKFESGRQRKCLLVSAKLIQNRTHRRRIFKKTTVERSFHRPFFAAFLPLHLAYLLFLPPLPFPVPFFLLSLTHSLPVGPYLIEAGKGRRALNSLSESGWSPAVK